MNHLEPLALGLLTFVTGTSPATSQSHDWENEKVFRINKEEPTATKMPFPSLQESLRSQRLGSPYCQMLNGTWKFHHVGHPDPQESGNRTEVRWATFSGGGRSLTFQAIGPHLLEVAAYPYTALEIELARHPADLRPSDNSVIHSDFQQMGLGGTNSWGPASS